MAAAPPWGFDELDDVARWVLSFGLPSSFRPPSEPLDEQSWAALVQVATQHRLTGLMIAAIAEGALPATDGQLEVAAQWELDATHKRIAYEALILEPLDALRAAGIEVRLLKGTAVASLEYSDRQMRPTSDLDVLVHAEDIDAAVDVLVTRDGVLVDPQPTADYYRLVGKGATVRTTAGMEVDFHRLLVWGPFGVRLPVAELWATDRSFVLGGVERLTLGREETLLHVCGHLLVLGVVRALEVRDVAQILYNPDLDAERVLDLARRWGQEALLATAIRMAERDLVLVEGSHPLSAWAAGYSVTLRDRLWLRAEAPVGRVHGVVQLAVYIELGRVPRAREARRVLRRANLRPDEGTYPRFSERVKRFAHRLRH